MEANPNCQCTKLRSRLIKVTAKHNPMASDLLDLACDFINNEELDEKFLEFAQAATIVSSWDNIAGIEYRDNLYCARLE